MPKYVATRESIVSAAYVLLGESPISSFTEAGVPALVASNLYETVVESCLTDHQWLFATKRVPLSKLSASPIDQNYQYGYQLPADLMRICTVNEGSDDFTIGGDVLFSNTDELVLTYIYRPDERFFPPYFTEYLKLEFAAQASIPISDSSTLRETFIKWSDLALKKARLKDNTSAPLGGWKVQGFTRGGDDYGRF